MTTAAYAAVSICVPQTDTIYGHLAWEKLAIFLNFQISKLPAPKEGLLGRPPLVLPSENRTKLILPARVSANQIATI